MEIISNFDFNVLDLIQYYLKCDFLDVSMKYITMLGNFAAIWIILAIILLLQKTKRKYGVMMIIALILSLIICNVLIKPIAGRIRPFEADEELFEMLTIKPPKDCSFPSGHTVTSFACIVILLHYNKKRGRFWTFIAILIAFSRIYLCVHYPSDVIAGIIIGIIIGIISKKIYYVFERGKVRRIFKKNNVFKRKYKEFINGKKQENSDDDNEENDGNNEKEKVEDKEVDDEEIEEESKDSE